jgi:hypothetical protein
MVMAVNNGVHRLWSSLPDALARWRVTYRKSAYIREVIRQGANGAGAYLLNMRRKWNSGDESSRRWSQGRGAEFGW